MKTTIRKAVCVLAIGSMLCQNVWSVPNWNIKAASVEKSEEESFVIKNGILKEYKGCSKKVAVPEGVTVIGKDAFSGNMEIESVTLPDTVESIGEGAFWQCENLSEIMMSDSVKTIGMFAFSGCKKLKSFVFPKGITKE